MTTTNNATFAINANEDEMSQIYDAVAAETTPTPKAATTAGVTIPAATFDYRQNDAVVTIHNPATGQYRTFRIKTLRGKWMTGRRILEILDGPDNTTDYRMFAWVNEDGIKVCESFRFFNKDTGRMDPKTGRPGVSDWEVFAKMIATPAKYEARGLKYLISAKCFKCGRALTVPESVLGGIGPECKKKAR